MYITPFQRYVSRVQHAFATNAHKQTPWETCVLRFNDGLDIVQFPWAEWVVPRGTIAGERRCLESAVIRLKNYSPHYPLCFAGYVSLSGNDIDGKQRKNIACAHFTRFDPYRPSAPIQHYYVNKRFHEVFGSAAKYYYLQPKGGYIVYTAEPYFYYDPVLATPDGLGSIMCLRPNKDIPLGEEVN